MPRAGVSEQTREHRRRAEEIARTFAAELAPAAAPGSAGLVALIGLPGAGKSHFGRLLAHRLEGVVVASDALRRRLFVAPAYTSDETRMVFAIAHALVALLLAQGRVVVFDATNLRELDRRPLARIAARAGARLVLVRVTAPEEEILGRLAQRRARGGAEDKSDADERVYLSMRERFEEPTAPYLVVDTTADLADAVEAVAKAIAAR